MEKIIKVKGMHCKSCEIVLKDSISEIKGVEVLKADSKKGEISVKYTPPNILDLIQKTIEKGGYKVIG